MLKFILLAVIVSFSVACESTTIESKAEFPSTHKVRAHWLSTYGESSDVYIIDVDTMYHVGDTLWSHTKEYRIIK